MLNFNYNLQEFDNVYLSEDGKFGQDNFKSVVLRWTISKQADTGEI